MSQAVAIFRADSLKHFSSQSLNPFSVNMLHGCLNWRHILYLVHGLQITKHLFMRSCIFILGFFQFVHDNFPLNCLQLGVWGYVCTHICAYIKKKKNANNHKQVLQCGSHLWVTYFNLEYVETSSSCGCVFLVWFLVFWHWVTFPIFWR